MFNTLDTLNELFIEMKTREQYALDKWKKQYNFEPLNKQGNYGYITVNGEKHKVNLSGKYKQFSDGKMTNFSSVTGIVPRQYIGDTSSDIGTINLNKNYFKLKNKKRRDAILQHEIGHYVLQHLPDPEEKKHELKIKNNNDRYNMVKYIEDHIIKNKSDTNSHKDFQEIEADQYSANRIGSRHLKRAIRNGYAIDRRKGGITTHKGNNKFSAASGLDPITDSGMFYKGNLSKKLKNRELKHKILNNYDFNIRKFINKRNEEDIVYRNRALKNKKLISSKLYK